MARVPRIYKKLRILIIALSLILAVYYSFQSLAVGKKEISTPIHEIKDHVNRIKIQPLSPNERPDDLVRNEAGEITPGGLPKLGKEQLEKLEEEIMFPDELGTSIIAHKGDKHSMGFTKHVNSDGNILLDQDHLSLPIVYNRIRQGKSSLNFGTEEEVFRIPLNYDFRFPLTQFIEFPKEKKTFEKIQVGRFLPQEPRFSAVKSLFIENWNQYFYFSKKYDSLKPLSLKGENDYIGWSMTLIDSLDTLFVMGFSEEFEMAVSYIDTIDFYDVKRDDVPVFEANIRILGGLLSAFDLSDDFRLLDKAKIVAEILLRAFDTTNHLPIMYYNLHENQMKREKHPSTANFLSELGSLSLEFTRLSVMTKDMAYFTYVMNLIDNIIDSKDDFLIKGLIPNELDLSGCELVFREEDIATMFDGKLPTNAKRVILVYDYNDDNELAYCIPSNKIKAPNANHQVYSLEGKSDSFYEYLLKLYILLNGNLDDRYLEFFQTAKEKIKKFLVFTPKMKEQGLKFLNEITVDNRGSTLEILQHNKVSHLSCFAGGFFTLMSSVLNDPSDLELGQQLTKSCYKVSQMVGLFPESFMVDSCDGLSHCQFEESEKIKYIEKHTVDLNNGYTEPHRTKYSITDEDKEYTVRTSSNIPYSPYDSDSKIWKTGEAANQPLEFNDMDPRHLLRPELIESLFINFRITGLESYREQAWELFQKILTTASVEITKDKELETVMASIRDVTSKKMLFDDELESWWFAETLKYFYLIFQDSKVLSLDEWVFNTEGHPLKKEKYWLAEY